MSPSDLQNEIIKRVRLLLEGFPLDTESSIPLTDNDTTPFKVFRQFLPEVLHDYGDYRSQDEKDKDIYPFVIVNLPGGQKTTTTEAQVEPVAFLIGVKNEDRDNRGFSDAAEAVQVIMDDFNSNPIVADMYVMQYPMNWHSYEEENTFPYFFVQINMNFEIETAVYRGGLDDDDKRW